MNNPNKHWLLAIMCYWASCALADDYLVRLSDQIENVPVIWQPPNYFCPTLRDIASRLPIDTNAKDADLITYTHEGTHFLSRNRNGQHGLYIGDGKRVYVQIPPIAISDLFQAIPINERGTIYETYRKQGTNHFWQDKSTMVLDEWLAYTHGSMARKEMSILNRIETDQYCAIMATYSWYLIKISKEKGIHVDDIVDWCIWNNQRCEDTIVAWDKLFTKSFRSFR